VLDKEKAAAKDGEYSPRLVGGTFTKVEIVDADTEIRPAASETDSAAEIKGKGTKKVVQDRKAHFGGESLVLF